ncbi:hypothetical protein C8R44DRAFT_891380 [Mycena epipterygia]|nr:hypothetical protein C8R44DRAFT_891380 [Mycena epipterygia]
MQLDKLTALKSALTVRGMMSGMTADAAADDDEDDDGTSHGPKALSDIELALTPHKSSSLSICVLAAHIQQPLLPTLLQRFLYEELNGAPNADDTLIPIEACPIFSGRITVHHPAIARFYAPSDLGGAGGMYQEHIRSNPNWHSYARRDTVLVDVGTPMMRGIVIGRVQLFSFTFVDKLFECALVNWLVPVGNAPDPDTAMWVVELECERGVLTLAIINADAIARVSHLIGVYGSGALPEDFHFSDLLDAFNTYFVNFTGMCKSGAKGGISAGAKMVGKDVIKLAPITRLHQEVQGPRKWWLDWRIKTAGAQ